MTASTLKTNTALVSFATSARNMAKAEGKVSDHLATVRADLAAFVGGGGKQPEARALFLQVNVSVILGVTLKAVLTTGDTSSAIKQLPGDRYLRMTSKPIKADELLAMLRALLAA